MTLLSAVSDRSLLSNCVPEDPFDLDSYEPGGCGTAALERKLKIGIWAEPSETEIFLDLLSEAVALEVLGLTEGELKEIAEHILERALWTPSGADSSDPSLRETLRWRVAKLQSSGELSDYSLEWLSQRARGW